MGVPVVMRGRRVLRLLDRPDGILGTLREWAWSASRPLFTAFQSYPFQVGVSHPGRPIGRPVGHSGDDGQTHPKGLQGRYTTRMGIGIQSDVGLVVQGQIRGRQPTQDLDPPWIYTQGPEAIQKDLPDKRVLAGLELQEQPAVRTKLQRRAHRPRREGVIFMLLLKQANVTYPF